jgi:putative transposase
VLVAWGFTEQGERVLVSVMLGMRESHEDWLALGRDLIARGLGAPMLIVADGAPGLIKAAEQCGPASDRQHCAVHRLRNLLAKLPERGRERVRHAYWQALDEAVNEPDGEQRPQALVSQLDKAGYTAAARCLADDLDALVVHLRYPTRHRRRWRSTNLLEGRSARSNAAPSGTMLASCPSRGRRLARGFGRTAGAVTRACRGSGPPRRR